MRNWPCGGSASPLKGILSTSSKGKRPSRRSLLRKRKTAQLRVGQTSDAVYRLLGPPDYITDAVHEQKGVGHAHWERKWTDAWRCDFDGPDDFSLLVLWDDNGNVRRIEKVTPALWRGDELFSAQAEKPMFRADGSLNGVHLYSKTFQGKIEEFVCAKEPK